MVEDNRERANNAPVLEAHGIIKEFPTTPVLRVLHGVDLRIERGEFMALVGPSGSGKSTLLNILGLLDVPTDGKLCVEGKDTSRLDDRARTELRGRALGFVFQFHHLLPALRAWENVVLPAAAVGGTMSASLRPRGVELLERVGLSEKIDSPARELSGGQQQRVAIARALAQHPSLVLADEPTGNLDQATAGQVFEVMRAENARDQTAFVIVTHDLALAARCDRVVQLVDGRVAYDGEAGDAFLRIAQSSWKAD